MNTTKILASTLIALASVAAGNAFADSYGRVNPALQVAPTGLSRAQVLADVVQTRQGVSAKVNDEKTYPVIVNTQAPKTAAEVRAELIQAQKDGSIPKYSGFDRG